MKLSRAFLAFFVLFLSVLSFPTIYSLSLAEGAPVSVAPGTITDDFVFGAGQTYLVSGPTVMTGAVTIEGGAIIKFDDAVTGASLDVTNPVFQTTSSNFAVFTSKHDNTAGEVISGSTGSPGVAQYTNALTLGASEARFVQIRHADVGIQFQGGGAFTLRDSEFFAVGSPLNAVPNTSASSVTLNNVLVAFSNDGPIIVDDGINPLIVTANNLTFYTLSGNGFDTILTSAGSTFSVTDSVFVDIEGTDVFKGSVPGVEDFNAFFQTPQNGSGANDLVLASDPLLTDFFIDQASPLINAGSKTSADAGLFHYTTNVDKSIESNTTVDMGYHIPPDITSFSILATNSIWLKKNSMSTGNIGVNDVTAGPWVNMQAQLVVGKNVVIPAEISLFSDSVKIKKDAVVNGSVFTNLLTNKGTINGPTINPLALPLSDLLPIFRSAVISPSAIDIDVLNGQELVLAPGEYGDITVNKTGNLRFSGGVYHIRSIFAKRDSSLSFDAASEIRIEQSLRTKRAVFVGPSAGSNMNAEDIQFFVEGFDDGSTPRTAKFGQSNTVTSHLYVPNGTIWLKKSTVASGAFFGKNVIVGQNTDVSEETGTSNPEVAAPIITPNGGSFFDSVSVNMSTITTGASIFYTLDGTTPTPLSNLFVGPFNLTNDATVSAVAARNGFIDSAVTTADFIVQPMPQVDPVAFDPAPDTFQTSVDVSLSTTTPDAMIHFTLDGTTPTTSSPVFTTAITLTDNTTVTAFAVKQDFTNSSITSAVYTLNPIPGIIPDAPPVTSGQSYDLASSTEFLYTGPDPVQTGMDPTAINPIRASIVRGRVLDGSGDPLPDVIVTILDHTEFGQTVTRSDGFYDMAINGGGNITVNFQKTGYLSAQRGAVANWQRFAVTDDVALIPIDSEVTNIDLSAITQVTEARGSVVTDSDGTRQATVLFMPGTTATLMMPDGTTQSVSDLNIRATEYTVGPNGPMAMPGPLPNTSVYTYAVELSADEAIAAGASDVVFSQPQPFYLDNFLEIGVGESVPTGYYDRKKGSWVPSENGLVIKVVSITEGKADLDLDGDDIADDALTQLGVTDEEREKLASLYTTGKTLWRVPMDHFTPWDCNWGFGAPLDAILASLNPKDTEPKLPPEDGTECHGCIVGVEAQSLGETIPIAGTPFSLNYRSPRTPGFKALSRITIPVIDSIIPASMLGIKLEVNVAGRTFNFIYDNDPSTPEPDIVPNMEQEFEWDGLDAYGRVVPGFVKADIKLSYIYPGRLLTSPRFGQRGGTFTTSLTGPFADTRNAVSLTTEIVSPIMGRRDLRPLGLGGWTVDPVHHYTPFEEYKTLLRGDGSQRNVEDQSLVVKTAFSSSPGNRSKRIVAVGENSKGDIYFIETRKRLNFVLYNNVHVIKANGQLAGSGIPSIPGSASDIAFDSEDNVYIVDSKIYKHSPNGTLLQTWNIGASAISIDSQDNIYVSHSNSFSKIDSSGVSQPILQNINLPIQFAKLFVDSHDNLYLTSGNAIYKVDNEGNPTFHASTILNIASITFDESGNIFVVEGNSVQLIAPDGSVRDYSDPYVSGFKRLDVPGKPVASTTLFPSDIWMMNNGNIVLSELFRVGGSNTIDVRILESNLPRFSAADIRLPSEEGSLLFEMDSLGRHLKTTNTLTGQTVFTFNYDPDGRLLSITDGDGDVTTFTYDASGNPTSVVSADGQVTTLTVDANGWLTSIINPENETMAFEYTPEGLLTKTTDARSNNHLFTYGIRGLLEKDDNPAGGFQQLARTETADGFSISRNTAEGRVSHFLTERNANGETIRKTTDASGFETTSLHTEQEITTTTTPDGTVIKITKTPDPRFNMQAPLSGLEIATPGGLTSTFTPNRAVTTVPATGELLTQTDTLNLNGRTFTSVFDKVTPDPSNNDSEFQFFSTSPATRTTTSFTDGQGRIRQHRIPGIFDSDFDYDTRGRLTTVTQSTGATARANTIVYNTEGFVDSITDAENRTFSFQYDSIGQITRQTLPDLREINFAYDANGNVASITPPGRPVHSYDYTTVDLDSQYTPPNIGLPQHATTISYNLDQDPTLITRPDGKTIAMNYDSGGRISSLVIPRGTTTLNYDPATGVLSSLTAPDFGTLAFTYDGSLSTGSTWGGPAGSITGNVNFAFDNDFRVTSRSVNGANTIAFGYDNDSLLTSAGTETLTYDPTNGLLTSTTLGVVTDTLSYSGFAEVDSYTANVNAAPVFSTSFVRDKLGRITQKTETVQGVAHVYDYTYDLVGRLIDVDRDGTDFSSYTYDSNSNRQSKTDSGGTTNGTYDVQDRLLTYGGNTYTYTGDGELLTKTVAGQTTSYSYDVLGNLISVTLPDATQIEYIVDAQSRRIGKKVNGTLERAWLYKDGLNPIAELGASGNVTARFVYASSSNIPDYLIKGGNTYRIISDHLGSPRLVINTADGTVAQTMDYDVWGNVIADTNPEFQPFGFAGGLYDTDTQLVRFGARDFDTESGRWTAKDPIEFSAGDTNLYGYVLNDPINEIDPSGLVANFAIGCGVGTAVDIGFQLFENGGKPSCIQWGRAVAACATGALGGGISGKLFGKYLKNLRKGLTTPKKYFNNKTYKEAEEAFTKKFGEPRGGGKYNKSFYNKKTKRTYNLHQDPKHRGGKPHIDIRKRDLPTNFYKDRPFFLKGG